MNGILYRMNAFLLVWVFCGFVGSKRMTDDDGIDIPSQSSLPKLCSALDP